MKQGWKAVVLLAVVILLISSGCFPHYPGHPGRHLPHPKRLPLP